MVGSSIVNMNMQGIEYINSGDLLADARRIVEEAQQLTRKSVNIALIRRNWLLGKRIAEEELEGESRADYGRRVLKGLSRSLTEEYGGGFEQRNLYRFLKFYRMYPDILTSLMSKSGNTLSWTHYQVLLRVENQEARAWYEREALHEGWSVRTLDRNVGTLYYDRLLMSTDKAPVEEEMHEKTAEYELNRLEFVKNPVIAEFLGVPQDKRHT